MDTQHPGVRLTATASLSAEERTRADTLLETCNHAEAIDIPIFLPDLVGSSDARTAILVTDGSALIGFAAVPDDSVPEASLMVHPDHRRRGIGTHLIAGIRAELTRRNLPGCLLVADQKSPSGRAFLAALGIPHDFSEYRLELDPAAIDRTRRRHDALTLRQATPDDAETLIRVLAAGTAVQTSDTVNNGFRYVIHDGMAGWVYDTYLKAGEDSPPAGTLVTTSALNLRAEPNTNAKILTVMPEGAKVTPTGTGFAGFIQVVYGNLTGWAAGAYLN